MGSQLPPVLDEMVSVSPDVLKPELQLRNEGRDAYKSIRHTILLKENKRVDKNAPNSATGSAGHEVPSLVRYRRCVFTWVLCTITCSISKPCSDVLEFACVSAVSMVSDTVSEIWVLVCCLLSRHPRSVVVPLLISAVWLPPHCLA